MKKYKIVVVAVSVCLIIAFGFVAFKTNLFKVSAGGTEDIGSTDRISYVKMYDELTDEQKEELSNIKVQLAAFPTSHLYGGTGYFPFQVAKYLGKVDESFTRMTLQEAKEIIEENKGKDKRTIQDAFLRRQPYPDASGDYMERGWVLSFSLDDEGIEVIRVLTYGNWIKINYYKDDRDTKNVEVLYESHGEK